MPYSLKIFLSFLVPTGAAALLMLFVKGAGGDGNSVALLIYIVPVVVLGLFIWATIAEWRSWQRSTPGVAPTAHGGSSAPVAPSQSDSYSWQRFARLLGYHLLIYWVGMCILNTAALFVASKGALGGVLFEGFVLWKFYLFLIPNLVFVSAALAAAAMFIPKGFYRTLAYALVTAWVVWPTVGPMLSGNL